MGRCCKAIVGAFASLFMCGGLIAQIPLNYQDFPAEQKRDYLWNEVVKSHQMNPLPRLSGGSLGDVLDKITGLFDLGPAFDHASDQMPKGRVKIIHSNGSVGKISLLPTPHHPFTGLYQTGAIGVVRLSLAASPTDESYIPGMAIKFIIPLRQSLNVHVMNCLEGQGRNWNFFAKEFTNEIAHPTTFTLKAIEKIFEWTRKPANQLPLWHIASWTNESKKVDAPITPERIYFRPASAITNLISEHSREDFRVALLKIPFGPLYEVYGDYKGVEYHIGTLMLESNLLASDYGDKHLFFQHQR